MKSEVESQFFKLFSLVRFFLMYKVALPQRNTDPLQENWVVGMFMVLDKNSIQGL